MRNLSDLFAPVRLRRHSPYVEHSRLADQELVRFLVAEEATFRIWDQDKYGSYNLGGFSIRAQIVTHTTLFFLRGGVLIAIIV